jgi:hypothetical protein
MFHRCIDGKNVLLITGAAITPKSISHNALAPRRMLKNTLISKGVAWKK